MLVLLVEDNPAEARLTREALLDSGVRHELQVVSDGELATRFLRREAPYIGAPRVSLILLDLNLPGKHGCEVLREIKNDPSLALIPVVVISNSQSPDDISEAYRHHASCYLKKAADLEAFFSSVRSMAEFWLQHVCLPP